tara:strand:- start:619 stop:1506 length:888 start_codon:yes stop_codon:yes gene_type:complete
MSKNKFAIFLIIISVFFAHIMIASTKLAQLEVNVITAALFRFVFGLIIIFPIIIKSKFTIFKTQNLKFHFVRSTLNLPAMLLGFGSISLIPIEKFTAIQFIVPFIVTILAVMFLREKIYIYRTIALILGFFGMLVIIRPGFIDISLGVSMALGSSFFWAVVIVMTKKMSADDSAITILAYQYIFMIIFTAILTIFFWETPSTKTLIFLFIAALTGTIFHLCINHAYSLVDVTMTQPYSFLGLIFSSVFGYFIFNEIPDVYTWVGAFIIFIGILIITYREMKLKKEIVGKKLNINS